MALAMLAKNRTAREIARGLRLSYTQLKELREKALPTYLKATEVAERPVKARDMFIQVASDHEKKLKEYGKLRESSEEPESRVGLLRL